MGMENVDMPEEIEWAKRKSNQRSVILRDLIETEELEKRAKGKLPNVPPGPKGKPCVNHEVTRFGTSSIVPFIWLIKRDSIVLTVTRVLQLVTLHLGTSALPHRHRPYPPARKPRGFEKTSGTIRLAIKRL